MDTAVVEVNNHEQFRRVALLMSGGCTCISAIIAACTPPQCYDSNGVLQANLIDGNYIVMSVQALIFVMLLMHYIHCGCLLRKMGVAIAFFYACMVGCMIWAQIIFF